MVNQILLYSGSVLVMLWGAAHLFATRSVVRGFGDISQDNRRIITMEWIVEGVCLLFIAALISSVTWIDRTSRIATAVYLICFAMLNVLSVISLLTGFKVSVGPFKLCPVVFTTASILVLLGACL